LAWVDEEAHSQILVKTHVFMNSG